MGIADRHADRAADLATGRITSRQLIEESLARIADPDGEGTAAFIVVYDEAARTTADWVDAMRKAGASLPEWAGIPVSIKDLFDVAGSVTTFASAVTADAPPAKTDAAAVARLLAVGLIAIGRTNMTEFAYGAIGLNARHGTPAAAWDRPSRRIPGGSTSGGPISISDGMACIALGSDSGDRAAFARPSTESSGTSRRAAAFRSMEPIPWCRA